MSWLRWTVSSLVAAGLWALAHAALQPPEYLFPAPAAVLTSTWESKALLWHHGTYTAFTASCGGAIGAVAGISVGYTLAFFRPVRWVAEPYLLAFQAFPREALAPLLAVWLGFGAAPKIVLSALICFFPVALSTLDGATRVRLEFRDLLRAHGASRWQVVWNVDVPSSIPAILSGLRVGLPLALIGAVIGEFLGGSRGLGYLVSVASVRLNTPLVFSCLVCLAGLGASLLLISDLLARIARPRFLNHLNGG